MTLEQATTTGPSSFAYWARFDRTQVGSWVALVLRLGLSVVWLVSGGTKIVDLSQSVSSVAAYKLFPYWLSTVIGSAQPIIEVLLGVALLVGVAVRVMAAASAILFVIYIGGIISVWARGLRIDCGCFSSGGALGADQSTTYGLDIVRDLGFVLLALLVFWWSRSRFALDSVLFPPVPAVDDDEDDDE
ncbi:hypothetical protein Athai_44580 [Actinocatenispora thailandica]|uniref:Methylamine utilisation protein MauE domain-containing protein n=1 Tax=Actinocatenispora thailandica TaxID=227318 RepID=A0A7R7DSB5_9ACTN|nr:MauE/DoxX family redox-associated membrane protein [Actinocatenispora thailandica]BCJ36955.1 hypothetical protein Athai_44580 [Actinocatenispora thailandica]